jgi:hypothetical protein
LCPKLCFFICKEISPGDEDEKSASVGVGISLWPPAVEAATETCSFASGPNEAVLETLSLGINSDLKVFQVLSFVTYFIF